MGHHHFRARPRHGWDCAERRLWPDGGARHHLLRHVGQDAHRLRARSFRQSKREALLGTGLESDPPVDDYEDIRWTDAHLIIKSNEHSPEELVELAGVEPSCVWRMGDVNPELPEHSEFRIRSASGIQIDTQSPRGTGQRHLDDLLCLMREHEDTLRRATTHAETEALVSVSCCSTYPMQSYYLDEEDLELLVRLGASLWIVATSATTRSRLGQRPRSSAEIISATVAASRRRPLSRGRRMPPGLLSDRLPLQPGAFQPPHVRWLPSPPSWRGVSPSANAVGPRGKRAGRHVSRQHGPDGSDEDWGCAGTRSGGTMRRSAH
jgi:hypothetical protein